MKYNSTAARKWARIIHRDLSYFFSGVLIIYAVSGIAMNHRDTINPDFSITRHEFRPAETLPAKPQITRDIVLRLLQPLDEAANYTKHYFPTAEVMKVFLKGGSHLTVNLTTGTAVYEQVSRRPLLSAMTRLHYNPGRWWTTFSDAFAVGLIVITVTGIVMVKGNKGLIGRGGIELAVGILIPLLFLFL